MRYTIYKTTNKINGKIYIGKHQTLNPMDSYLGSGHLLQRAIRKYGSDNFYKEILFDFDDEEEMNNKERELVTEEFCNADENYNLAPGGKGGFGYINSKGLHSVDGMIEYSRSKEGRATSAKTLLATMQKPGVQARRVATVRMRHGSDAFASFRGRKHSDETKTKMSRSSRGNGVGATNSQFGTIWITNGAENRKIRPDDLHHHSGFWKGRTKQ